MAGEEDVLFFGFLGDREKGFARRHGDYFDEICSTLLEVPDGSTGFFGIRDGILLGSLLAAAGQPGTGGDDVRTEEFAGFDIALPGEKHIEVAAHVAHTCDAIGEQEREQGVFAPGGIGADAGKVHMHVPQAGNEEFATSVDDAGGLIKLGSRGRADGSDSIFDDDDGLIRLRSAARSVDDADMLQDQRNILAGK